MAPRKKVEEKEKPAAKATADEAAGMILNYLPAAAKILKDLHERNEIEGRAAGKQIVYHAIQNPEDSVTPEALAALDSKASDLRDQTAALNATAKTLRTTLASLTTTLSTADLVANVQALEAERMELVGRLAVLKAGKAKKVTKREREEVDRECEKWGKLVKKRQKISSEMWKDTIEPCIEGEEQKAEVRESLGLDE
ncbi:uncharacterized protein N0V89_009781 [Didymosphaeria variabile]|uniref:TBPIP-domain-containing protein n=1 Tax=Didymosphaeria variabile TaxID=1932322 RepID=A0A9W8XEH2_9PLEO|nr:uncharacterized protein N0V89_009781 [Didymosphaeria variabile]KAJ4348407.1 hypothetical protein N0V89_009781 [Didymosphaeria variabile]